jgi:DNA-binding response OmpR family regulator
MAGIQSNQQHINISEHSTAGVVLYVTDKNALSAFHAAHLRDAGYELHAVSTASEALISIRQLRIDVVVIGHELQLPDRVDIEDSIRQLHPKPRVVLLYETSISKTEQADAVLNINSEPQHLVQTIRYLLTGSD